YPVRAKQSEEPLKQRQNGRKNRTIRRTDAHRPYKIKQGRNFMGGFRKNAVVLTLALGMTAAGTQASWALTKWRQGIVPFKGDAGFLYMAKEKGFFQKHGVDV